MSEPIRAVVFDVYKTLLEVGPDRLDEYAFEELHRRELNTPPGRTLAECLVACNNVVARMHQHAQAPGIAHPEVQWPEVLAEVLPGFADLPEDRRIPFQVEFMGAIRKIRRMPGALELLDACRQWRLPMGIASNAQAYTLAEMRAAGIDPDRFDPCLCFWSFEHGFSKPNPHAFRILEARLAARGFRAKQILMVGDRADNDIEPARRIGWHTWQVRTAPPENPASPQGGPLNACAAWLATQI